MRFNNRWTMGSSYDFQAHQQRSQRRCCFSQNGLLWFEVLPDMLPALAGLSPVLPGAPRLVVAAPSSSEARQECPPRVWYSPEIDASKFILHILSDTPGGFQWIKYILLMICNTTHHLGDGKHVNLRQRVQCSARAIRAIRSTWVFLTDTRVVADVTCYNTC